MIGGLGLRSAKDRRCADFHPACDKSAGDVRNRGLPVEKPLAQGIEVDHRRNGNNRAAAAAEKRQQDTRVERMFREAMGQRVTRQGGGHRKEAERQKAEERVPSKAENGNDERDGERRPRQAGKEGQAKTGTATMNLQERGDPGHDRQCEDCKAKGQYAEGDGQRDGKKNKRHGRLHGSVTGEITTGCPNVRTACDYAVSPVLLAGLCLKIMGFPSRAVLGGGPLRISQRYSAEATMQAPHLRSFDDFLSWFHIWQVRTSSPNQPLSMDSTAAFELKNQARH